VAFLPSMVSACIFKPLIAAKLSTPHFGMVGIDPLVHCHELAVTEFVGSQPTKTPTFPGDALGDVLMCTCKKPDKLFSSGCFR